MDTPTLLPSPAEMIAHLDQYVHGQKRAKKDLAVSLYNHYLGKAYAEKHQASPNAFGRNHILMLGPTGTGKTYMVKTLADFLGVPIAYASATSLVQAGYKGQEVETLIDTLLSRTANDPASAQRGVVFIDEIDKIKRSDGFGGPDVSGEGVQNALLTMFDGRSHRGVDTAHLLFVCTGAFSGLPDIVRRRTSAGKVIGFGCNLMQVPELTEDAALAEVSTEDLKTFGFIPEMIGRFAVITAVNTLTKSDLMAVLTQTRDSILLKHQRLFESHGIKLTFEPAALEAIAELASLSGTGARGLERMVLRSVDDVDWRLLELYESGVTEVVITAPTARRESGPVLKPDPCRAQTVPCPAQVLRQRALRLMQGAPSLLAGSDTPAGLTNIRGWRDEEIRQRLDQVLKQLDWDSTTGSARKWWEAFENENQHRLGLVLRLAEELLQRKATVTEFFLAYVYSNTDNIQANLYYLDYTRLKKEEEQQKKKNTQEEKPPSPAAQPPPPPSGPSGDILEVTEENFEEEVLRAIGPVVVTLVMPSSNRVPTPPLILPLKETHPEVKFVRFACKPKAPFSKQLPIRLPRNLRLPCHLVYLGGKVNQRFEGSDATLNLRSYLARLQAGEADEPNDIG